MVVVRTNKRARTRFRLLNLIFKEPFHLAGYGHSSTTGGYLTAACDHRQELFSGARIRLRPTQKKSRQRPTLPREMSRSTIGAERLNDRVRDGIGCFPFAMATGNRKGFEVRVEWSGVGEASFGRSVRSSLTTH